MTDPNEKPRIARNINSSRPFRKAVYHYRNQGWLGTIALPPKDKFPPPTGFTGRGKPYPDDDQIAKWIEGNVSWMAKPEFANCDPRKANIGIRLGAVTLSPERIEELSSLWGDTGRDHDGNNVWDSGAEIIGIDVDDYIDGDKVKTGAAQLESLEAEYGQLPPTWRSTSREGKSGIRFFLSPSGFAYRGKADEHIDIIQSTHRFAVVAPSYHPSGGQYTWYDPQGNRTDDLAKIPNVIDLPILPPQWFVYLTQDRTRDEGVSMDMDTSAEEIYEWAKTTLASRAADGPWAAGPRGLAGMCPRLRKVVKTWRARIREDPESHSKITGAHWNLIHYGLEGHAGWDLAVAAVEKTWKAEVKRNDKRTFQQFREEIFRSKVNCIRKIKGKVDEAAGLNPDGSLIDSDFSGVNLVQTSCSCPRDEFSVPVGIQKRRSPSAKASNAHSDSIDNDPELDPFNGITLTTGLPAVTEYEMTDDGNAKHWLDMAGGAANVKWIPETKTWLFWSVDAATWLSDSGPLARRIFEKVKVRQFAHADSLSRTAEEHARAGRDTEFKTTQVTANAWRKWAVRSGSNLGAIAAIDNAKNYAGVELPIASLDANPLCLGVGNGVLELSAKSSSDDEDAEPWNVRPARKSDFITMNTGIPALKWSEFGAANESGSAAYGKKLWDDYLNLFLPDLEVRDFTQKIMGYGLLGDNPEKLFVFLKGIRDTGKTTFMNCIIGALGQYSGSATLSVFQEHKLNPALADALPKRMITASEIEGGVLHATAIKRLSGDDEIAVELKGSNLLIKRRAAFLTVIGTNADPNVLGADEALRRRLAVIPFETQISGHAGDSAARDLRAYGGPAVLRWMIDGWAMYLAEGLREDQWPAAVRLGVEEMFGGMNSINSFAKECIRRIRGEKASKSLLPTRLVYDEYEKWCVENRIRESDRLTRPALMKRMAAIGFGVKRARFGSPGAKSALEYALVGAELVREPRVISMQKRKK